MNAKAFDSNPFPGLRSFEESDAGVFFGREAQVDELLHRLAMSNFLAVVGTSGSGKSSFIKAGLIPALYKGFITGTGTNWQVVSFRPGDSPLDAMSNAINDSRLINVGRNQDRPTQNAIINAKLLRSSAGLYDLLQKNGLPENENVLILVDQFEELFRYKQKNGENSLMKEDTITFIKLLLDAVRREKSNIYVIITIRSDFLGYCAELPGLVEAINKGQYLIPKMDRQALRLAISGPLALGGVGMERDMLDNILNDSGESPDVLPVLQHAMMRTWDYWSKHSNKSTTLLRMEDYEAIGTVKNALSIHAEEAFSDLATDKEKKIGETLFKSLTEKKEDGQETRRPCSIGEVSDLTKTSINEVIKVLEVFMQPGRSFLFLHEHQEFTQNSIIDISHESLMRVWGRLRNWLDEEFDSVQTYLRLSTSAALYQAGRSGLLKEPELEMAMRWYERSQPSPEWAKRYDSSIERAIAFLLASKRQKNFEIENEKIAQKNKLLRAKLLAAVLGTFTLLSLLFLVFAVIAQIESQANEKEAVLQKEKAEESKQSALRQREHAVRSEQEAIVQKENAILSEREAIIQKENALISQRIAEEQTLIAEEKEKEALTQKQKAIAQEKIAQEQRILADSARLKAEVAKKTAQQARNKADSLRILSVARNLAIQSLRLQPNTPNELKALLAMHSYGYTMDYAGKISSSDIYEALHFSVQNMQVKEFKEPFFHSEQVKRMSISLDGKTMISGSDDGQVKIWDINPASPNFNQMFMKIDACAKNRCGIRELAYFKNTDSQYLVTSHLDKSVRFWVLKGGKTVSEQIMDNLGGDVITSILFVEGGGKFVTADKSGFLKTWASQSPAKPIRILSLNKKTVGLALAEQTGQIAVLMADGEAKKWDIPANRLEDIHKPSAGMAEATALAFAPGGETLAIGYSDGKIETVFLKKNAQSMVLQDHKAAINAIAINSKGILASVSMDNTLNIYDLSNLKKDPIKIDEGFGWLLTLAFDGAGEKIYFSGADKKIHVVASDPAVLSKYLCSQVKKNLTETEWNNYIGNDIPYRQVCIK